MCHACAFFDLFLAIQSWLLTIFNHCYSFNQILHLYCFSSKWRFNIAHVISTFTRRTKAALIYNIGRTVNLFIFALLVGWNNYEYYKHCELECIVKGKKTLNLKCSLLLWCSILWRDLLGQQDKKLALQDVETKPCFCFTVSMA